MALSEQNLLKSGSELGVEDIVKDGIEGAVEVSQPQEYGVENVAFEFENGRQQN